MPGADGEPSTVVLDATVAVRWVVPEQGSEQAAELLGRPIAWVAPRLMLTEVASALRRKVVGDELRVQHAAQALDAIIKAVTDGTVRLAEDEELARQRGISTLFVPSA